MNAKIVFLSIFISLFYLVGFYILGHTVRGAWRSLQAASWPTARGNIAHVSLKEDSDSDGTSYEVEVKYTYSVNGATYEGTRLAFGYSGTSGRKSHDEIYNKLIRAKSVAVRYHPSDPAMSCLSYGMHRSILIGLAFSVTWLAFILGFTLLFWLFSRKDGVLLDNLLVQ